MTTRAILAIAAAVWLAVFTASLAAYWVVNYVVPYEDTYVAPTPTPYIPVVA